MTKIFFTALLIPIILVGCVNSSGKDAVEEIQEDDVVIADEIAENINVPTELEVIFPDTSDWEVFENEQFKLKHPKNYQVNESLSVQGNQIGGVILKSIEDEDVKMIVEIIGPFEKTIEKEGYFDNWLGWAGRPGGAIGTEQEHVRVQINNTSAFYQEIRGFGYQNYWKEKHVNASIVLPNESRVFSVGIGGDVVSEEVFSSSYKDTLFGVAESFVFKI